MEAGHESGNDEVLEDTEGNHTLTTGIGKAPAKKKKNCLTAISDSDWNSLEEIMAFLKPFEEYTTMLSARNTLTISDVLPIQQQLLDTLLDVENNPSNYHEKVVAASRNMLELHQKYCRNSSAAYKLGHVLDPRYKLKLLEMHSVNLAGSAKEILQREYQLRKDKLASEVLSSKHSVPVPVTERTSAATKQVRFRAEVFAKLNAADNDRSISDSDDEIKRYLEEKREPEDTDVLKWWHDNSYKYPILSKIARDVLSMPASSVASESAFSVSGQVITDHRASLDSKTVSILMELESWMNATTAYGWKAPSWSAASPISIPEGELGLPNPADDDDSDGCQES